MDFATALSVLSLAPHTSLEDAFRWVNWRIDSGMCSSPLRGAALDAASVIIAAYALRV